MKVDFYDRKVCTFCIFYVFCIIFIYSSFSLINFKREIKEGLMRERLFIAALKYVRTELVSQMFHNIQCNFR